MPAKTPRPSPGRNWRYARGTSNVLMRALRRAAQSSPDAFARLPREALFAPLGMRSAIIELDAAGMPVGSSFMHA